MNIKKMIISIFFILLLFILIPLSVGATTTTPSLPNPLEGSGVETPSDLIGLIIKSLVGLVGAVALVFFILGSTTWLTSAGNPEKVKSGTKIMIFSTLGVLVIFLSYMIAKILLNFLETGAM